PPDEPVRAVTTTIAAIRAEFGLAGGFSIVWIERGFVSRWVATLGIVQGTHPSSVDLALHELLRSLRIDRDRRKVRIQANAGIGDDRSRD
ncbi:MAG: hypothetical protein M3N26_06790, partial [Pseudomonadota bacterium]|nr:hypothetical protein [Pseudomonadota bacterium]